MNVLFFGTPALAVPYLDWLNNHHTVVGVVCQPDRPVGRGYKLTSPPVKEFAVSKNLPVFQPEGRWEQSFTNQLKKTEADVGVVVAYGRLIPEAVFTSPKFGCFNIHFSLLPYYRGAAPMQWALVNGEKKTGVTSFWLVNEMDAGDIFHQSDVAIEEQDDATSLKEKLIQLGVNVLADSMKDVSENKISKKPQTGTPTFAPLLKKEDGKIDWSKPASSIVNLVRGLCEWPGAWTDYTVGAEKKKLKILKAVTEQDSKSNGPAGKIISANKTEGLKVQAGAGSVILLNVQAEGKKPMPVWDFWQGSHLKIQDKFQ